MDITEANDDFIEEIKAFMNNDAQLTQAAR